MLNKLQVVIKCCTNMHTVQGDEPKQEIVRAEKCYTNMDNISKSNNKLSQWSRANHIKQKYFLSDASYESNMKGSTEMTQQIYKTLKMYLMALGALMVHFHCS